MSKKPKDHTTVYVATFSTGKPFTESESITFYKNVANPLHLPDAALCDETINEWATYKHWEIEEKARRAKEKLACRRLR